MTTNDTVNSDRKTAVIVGVLFIIATVASSLCMAIAEPILEAPDLLARLASDESQVMVAALLMAVDAVAVVGIAVAMHRILKRLNETLAIGYVAARSIEGVFHASYAVLLLSLPTLGQEFVKAGAPDAPWFQTTGTVLLSVADRAFDFGLGLPFAISALILNYLLFRSKLVPRWLSAWGLVGGAQVLVAYLLEYFGIHLPEALHMLIALQEMVFAVWLIAKGFNTSAIA